MRCEKLSNKGEQCILDDGHNGKHQLHPVHECHWPTCKESVDPSMWGCKKHWFKLPKRLRDRVWATYRAGQEVTKTPSAAYMKVVLEVQDWAFANPDKN